MTKKRMANDERIIFPKTEKSEEEEDDEEEEEEETMKTFFAMIRDYSRRKNELKNHNMMHDELETTRILRRKELEKKRKSAECSGWVPSFRWEDFNDDKKKMVELTQQQQPELIINSRPPATNTNTNTNTNVVVVVNDDDKVVVGQVTTHCKVIDKKGGGVNLDLKLAL